MSQQVGQQVGQRVGQRGSGPAGRRGRRRVRVPLPRSLRSQVTAGAVLLIMVSVALAGLIIVARIDHRDRTDVDRQLTSRADKVREDSAKLLSQGDQGVAAQDDDYGGLLAGSESLVRLLDGTTVVAQRGEQPAPVLPVPTTDGFSTVVAGGRTWRSLVQPLDASATSGATGGATSRPTASSAAPSVTSGTAADTGSRLQVLQDLNPIEERLADNTRLVTAVTATTTALSGIAVWLLTRVVLSPLERLRAGALRVRPGDEAAQQLPPVERPREVADLSTALNSMLSQLQTSMRATRRFTADAGHELRNPLAALGMNLETLRRNPDLPVAHRAQALDAMAVQQQRITALLAGLQALARGDTGSLPEHAPVDLGDLLTEAVRDAGRRHPEVGYRLTMPVSARRAAHAAPRTPPRTASWTPGSEPAVEGWYAGLRLAVDNLLDNAALHGRPGGEVLVELAVEPRTPVRITVADDGPGIPADQREAMKGRFARGARPRSEGSGLGLALVEQQAELHGGSLELGRSAAGGLRADLLLPLIGAGRGARHGAGPGAGPGTGRDAGPGTGPGAGHAPSG